MHEPEEPSKAITWRGALLFPYECVVNVDLQLELIVCSQTPSHFQEGDTRFKLIAKDLVTATQDTSVQRLKGKRKN